VANSSVQAGSRHPVVTSARGDLLHRRHVRCLCCAAGLYSQTLPRILRCTHRTANVGAYRLNRCATRSSHSREAPLTLWKRRCLESPAERLHCRACCVGFPVTA
jgi:hypothetical protein